MATVDELLGPPPTANAGSAAGAALKNLAAKGEGAPTPAAQPGQPGSIDDMLGPVPDAAPSKEGLPFLDRVALERADNPSERKIYLESRYGKGSVGTDNQGRTYVSVNGKRYDPDSGSLLGRIGASAVATLPSLGGAAGGALLGAEAGTAIMPGIGTVAGGLLGAGIGAATGKAGDEIVKNTQGLQDKSPEEVAGTLSREGEMGVLGEGAGGIIGKGLSRLTRGPLPKLITGANKETAEMTERVLDKGARPPATSTMPSARSIQFTEALAHKIVGPNQAQQLANAEFAKNEVRQVLTNAGVPESHMTAMMDDINGEAALSTREVGEHIQSHLRAHQEALEQTAQSQMSEIQGVLDGKLKHLDNLTQRYKTGDLGVDAARGIQQARTDFSQQANKVYQKVDRLVGDEPLVPSQRIKREAQAILDEIPKTAPTPATPGGTARVAKETPAGGKIFSQQPTPGTPGAPGTPIVGDTRLIKILGDLQKMPEKVSFREAQEIRSTLRQLGDLEDLTPGVSKKRLNDLRDSVDLAFNAAAADPKAARARNLLEAADNFYSNGIQKFNDVTVNKIVNDMKAGLPPNPETVAKLIVQPGQTARVVQIKKMLGDEVWGRVVGADFGRMIDAATKTGENVADGMKLLSEIDKRGATFNAVYGPKMGGEIREFAQGLAAMDQKVDLASLAPGKLQDTIRTYQASQQALEDFMKRNYLSELTSPTRSPDDVLRFIVQPKEEAQLLQAVKFFGESSPQMTAIRDSALHDLVKRTVVKNAGSDQKILSSRLLEREMGAYTRQQQEILFPNGLADDIKMVAKEMDFVFGKGESSGKSAAGIIGGGILKLPLFIRAPIQVWQSIQQAVFSSPGVIRALAVGLKGTGPVREAARTAMMNIVRYNFLSGGDSGETQGSAGPDQPGTGASGEQPPQGGDVQRPDGGGPI